MKELKSIETSEYALCVFECNCGFHIGLDFTYLDQINELMVECPVCKEIINTNKIN